MNKRDHSMEGGNQTRRSINWLKTVWGTWGMMFLDRLAGGKLSRPRPFPAGAVLLASHSVMDTALQPGDLLSDDGRVIGLRHRIAELAIDQSDDDRRTAICRQKRLFPSPGKSLTHVQMSTHAAR